MDDPGEDVPGRDWEKSVVVTVALGAGILLILALATVIALALLGPYIGHVYSGGGPAM